MRPRTIAALFALAAFVLVPTEALGVPNNESATYEWHLEVPNVSQASNGDTVSVTGSGEFGVHPKSATGGGEFTHEFADGGSVSGTYEVTGLVSFQPYGCGIVASVGAILPPDFCGGKLKMRVLLSAGGATLPGTLTVFCIIGPNPPNSHDDPSEEGIGLVVPGVANFNRIMGGMNVYILQA
jgi:hypothetical protein